MGRDGQCVCDLRAASVYVDAACVMRPGAKLFVYGTLRQGYAHPMAAFLANHSVTVTPATYKGRMYAIGDYPGVIPSMQTTDQVKGEVFALLQPVDVFAALDDYEECSQAHAFPHAYARIQTRVNTLAGEVLSGVWIYLYTRDTQSLRSIPSGDFFEHD